MSMTFARKLALRISGFVARYASPGWKDWAQAMSAEVAYISGDWAALSWALGGARILLDYRPAPLHSLTEARAAAMRFVERIRMGFDMVFFLVSGPMQVLLFFLARNSHQRLSFIVNACAGAICWARWLMDRRRLKDPANDETFDDDLESALLYRRELERYKVTMWIPIFAVYLTLCALLAKDWSTWVASSGWECITIAGFVLIALAFRYALRGHQRRIDELDALLATEVRNS
jgi:hypothetical protein